MQSRSTTLWTFAITSVALFMVTLDNLVVTTALPVIRHSLHASLSQLEWTVNAYTLTFAVLLLTGAALGDRTGRVVAGEPRVVHPVDQRALRRALEPLVDRQLERRERRAVAAELERTDHTAHRVDAQVRACEAAVQQIVVDGLDTGRPDDLALL